jgi:outer membrane murein-binding lipoprotein Lpp
MIWAPRQDKARRFLAAVCACLLCGCVSPQKVQKARTDFSTYSAEQRERNIEQICADAGAMPGTEANLECRLGLNKPSPNPPAH